MHVNLNNPNVAADSLSDFIRLFGSEEVMRKHFPKTYQAYRNTVDNDNLKSSASDYVDIDIIHVAYTDNTKKQILVEFTSDVQVSGGYCILSTEAINARTSQPLASSYDNKFVGNTQETSLLVNARDVSQGNIIIKATVFTIGDYVKSYTMVVDNLSGYLLDFTSKFTIEHPKKTHTNPSNNDINIAYRWSPGFSADKLDYFYDKTVMADSQFRIPSKGKVVVNGVNLQMINSCQLTAENPLHDIRYHSTQTGAVLQNSTTITWDFPVNWGFKDTEIVTNTYEYVVYTLAIKAVAQGKACTFLITNNDKGQLANAKHIFEKIYVYRDCFIKGTKITMADGKQQLVEMIKTGDRVLSENGQTASVSNIQCVTQSCSLVRVYTKDGQEIYTTEYHPFVTKTGLRCASLLQVNDVLMTADGEKVIELVCASPEEEGQIYIITLNDGGKRLYANGFLVGDSETELTEKEKAINLRYRVDKEWRRDYDSWVEKEMEKAHME